MTNLSKKTNKTIAFPDIKNDLPVMEQFYTLQGEGYHTGRAAYFIRLGGCDVGCHWCDVKESWDAHAHKKVKITELVEKAKSFPAKTAVITGGEPLMHNLDLLCASLKEAGVACLIETSGAHLPSGSWDWFCLSPKKFKSPVEEAYGLADELKIIIYHESDFDWAKTHASKVKPSCRLFLQPEWSKREAIVPSIVDYIKDNPVWKTSLQTHKYLNIR